MALENIEIVNGISLVIFCSISIVVGFRIILKYFKNKENIYLYVGFFWILLVCPWYSGTLAFIMILVTGKGITLQAYIIIGNILIPVAITLWITAFTELFYKESQKIIVGIFGIFGILFFIFLFYTISVDTGSIAELKGAGIDIIYRGWIVIYYIIILIILLATGIIFARASLRSENPEFKLRGKLLLIAFISYVFGSAIDALVPKDFLFLLIVRALQILSVIIFYHAFMMPKWIRNLAH